MPDPQLEEFCRIRGVADCRPDVFRRLQRHVSSVVQPQLDERLTLQNENADLKQQVVALRTRIQDQQTAKAPRPSGKQEKPTEASV